MRKKLRLLLLASTLFAVPAANAIDMNCISGNYYFFSSTRSWRCYYVNDGSQCLLCSAMITVEG